MTKILLIEDNDQLVKLYQGKLEDEGFDVTVALNGKRGLDLAKSQKYDLILLDIMLPEGINGFDVLEALKKDKTLRKIPVIVLTNLASEEKVAKDIGATDYMVKANVDPKDVVEKIKKVVE